MTGIDRPVEAHPAADVFPMMSPDELKDLAADIKKNGQAQPIVVHEGWIIDGRNRLAATRIAKVDPEWVEFGGAEADIPAFVLSSNLARRHMNKGQRAMAAVMVNGGRKTTKRELAAAVGVNNAYISEARQVLDAAPDQAQRVIAGEIALNAAIRHVKAKAAEKERAEKQRVNAEATAVALREELKDLEGDMEDITPVELPPPPAALNEDFDVEGELGLDVKGGLDEVAMDNKALDAIVTWSSDLLELAKRAPAIDGIPSEPALQQMTARVIEGAITTIVEHGRRTSIALMAAVEEHQTLRSVQ